MQAGLSRELFDAWCEDPRNGAIIADFAVQGTLAREILGEPSHVVTRAGQKVCCKGVCDFLCLDFCPAQATHTPGKTTGLNRLQE